MKKERVIPRDSEVKRIFALLEPWRILTSPDYTGIDLIPDQGPLLFVGNHTLLGVLDAPLLFRELYLKRQIFLRALGDHIHFKLPIWRDFLHKYGVVDGNRENCSQLMEERESILVFPGGSREVAKRKGERYKLIWDGRYGFAKMAIRHQCTIVPFSAVGVEDGYDIVFDAEDLMSSPIGPIIKKLGIREDTLLPVIHGIGPTMIPRPQRLYFQFHKPIVTSCYGGELEGNSSVEAVWQETYHSVEYGIKNLIEKRRSDPNRRLLPRVLSELTRLVEARQQGKRKTRQERI
jgi:1-acyl-sn-glycerol-3-phosphate acyltransferase